MGACSLLHGSVYAACNMMHLGLQRLCDIASGVNVRLQHASRQVSAGAGAGAGAGGVTACMQVCVAALHQPRPHL